MIAPASGWAVFAASFSSVFLSNPYNEIVSPGYVCIFTFPEYDLRYEFSATRDISICEENLLTIPRLQKVWSSLLPVTPVINTSSYFLLIAYFKHFSTSVSFCLFIRIIFETDLNSFNAAWDIELRSPIIKSGMKLIEQILANV